MKAVWNGVVVAESDDTVVVEGNHYFPEAAVKRDYLAHMFAPLDMDMMQRVRRALDPLEIANPGKMFPGGEAPALQQHGLHPLEKAGLISRE